MLILWIGWLSSVLCTEELSCRIELIGFEGKSRNNCVIREQAIGAAGFVVKQQNTTVEAIEINSNKNVEFIPEKLAEVFPDLVIVYIEDCAIKSVGEEHFQNLHKLLGLHLSKNQIETIHDRAFKDLGELQRLNLEDNHLKSLSPSVLAPLGKLEVIFLSNNRIRSPSQNIFDGLKSITSIEFNNNWIQSLDDDIFKNLATLEEIELANNVLVNITGNLFSNNKKLLAIDLKNNKIESISSTAFAGLNLVTVDLRDNVCVKKKYETENFAKMERDLQAKCRAI